MCNMGLAVMGVSSQAASSASSFVLTASQNGSGGIGKRHASLSRCPARNHADELTLSLCIDLSMCLNFGPCCDKCQLPVLFVHLGWVYGPWESNAGLTGVLPAST